MAGPVHGKVTVSVPPETAFPLFVMHLGSWWPLADRHVLGRGGSVAFEAHEVVERRGSERSVWASIVDLEAPDSVHLAFFPRVGPDLATDVRLKFQRAGDGTTEVTLEHHGWERLAGDGGRQAHAQVHQGWVEVLDAYRCHVEAGGGTQRPAR